MEVVDGLNRRYGRNAVYFAASGMPQRRVWQMKQVRRSPRYTTRWNELVVVR